MSVPNTSRKVHPVLRIGLTVSMIIVSYLSFIYLDQLWAGEYGSLSLIPISMNPFFSIPLGYGVWINLSGDLHSRKMYVLLAGLIFGIISFIPGIIIPSMVEAGPEGPLIGILLTGPIGLIIGLALGALYWERTNQAHRSIHSREADQCDIR